MNLLESKIEADTCRRAESELGVLNIKLTPKGKTGYPDRMFFIPGGKPLLIEFKRPGEDPRPKQTYIHNVLRFLEYHVEVHDDTELALRSIAAALDAAKLLQKSRKVSPRT